jgi:hypothetical protein
MKTARTNDAQKLRELAQFLDEHPGFSPLFSDEAILCGFRVGGCDVSLPEMDLLIGSRSEAAAERTCAQ